MQVTDSAAATASTPFKLTVTPAALVIAVGSPLAAGQGNVAYSQTMAAMGGTPPYTWTTISGILPAGLTFSSAGVLSGTPTSGGTYSFKVQVTDHASVSVSAWFQLTITPGMLAITTASPLPNGLVNADYWQAMAATGGKPPYSWAATSRVPGLSFTSTGAWSGIPSTPGIFSFTIQVVDSAGATASSLFLLTISPNAKVVITTASPLPAGTVNAKYSVSMAANQGTPPYLNWTTTTGTLPPGLTLSPAGVLGGTPTTAGTSNFTVQVSDTVGVTASAPFQLTINPAKLAITTTLLPLGQVGTAYSQTLQASGGTLPYTWSSFSAMPGLTLSSAGVLSGTPNSAGTNSLVIQVTDSAAANASVVFQLLINPPPPAITTPSLSVGQAGAAYSQSLAASGGTPPYTWVAKNSVPGLTLSSSGVLSGTPTSAGTYSLTVQITDQAGTTASSPFQLTINPAALAITTSSPLAAGKTNTSYSLALAASGGTPPYANWTVSTGSLPPGLTLSATGVLNGTPTTAGTYTFTIHLADYAGATVSTPFQLTINAASLAITTASPLPAGMVNISYSQPLVAGGGTPPYTNWIASNGTLPSGLTLSSAGVLSGTPTTGGTFSFTVQVTDNAGTVAFTPFQLNISPTALTITTASPLPAGHVNSAYSQALAAIGGILPYANWTTSNGTLPAGLTLSSAGVLSGTPTAAGTYSFTMQVTDKAGATASTAFQLTIAPPSPAITTTSPLPEGKVNTGYSLTLGASGGTPPYTNWTTSNGALPPGLTLSPAGLLSGTPANGGTYSFTIQVTDSAGVSASASFQLIVNQLLPSVVAAVNSANFVAGLPVTTGSWVALYGTNLAPAGDSRMWNPATEIVNGKLPASLDGTSVTVNGRAATVEYISPGQVNIQMPDDTTIGPVPVVVTTAGGVASGSFTVSYAQFSPGFFPAIAPYIASHGPESSTRISGRSQSRSSGSGGSTVMRYFR